MLGGFSYVGWIDGLHVGTFPLRGVVARANYVRSAPLLLIYWIVYHAIKDTAFWGY